MIKMHSPAESFFLDFFFATIAQSKLSNFCQLNAKLNMSTLHDVQPDIASMMI